MTIDTILGQNCRQPGTVVNMKRVLFLAFSLTILFLLGTGCRGAPKSSAESTQSGLPSGEAENTTGIPTVAEQSSAISYRLVFPSESVFSCAESDSSLEMPFRFAKDGVENGRVCYDASLIPFSDSLLEHPDASMLMWTGAHQVLMESWEIDLNDGWICYMYQGEMDHATGTGDPGGRGTAYSAMIGQPGDENVFCLFWDNYFETSFDEPLESFQENDPGYVSPEDMKSFLSGVVIERES